MSNERNFQFRLSVNFGRVELRSWLEFDGEKLIGMGMRSEFDENGKIVSVDIAPTGITASIW